MRYLLLNLSGLFLVMIKWNVIEAQTSRRNKKSCIVPRAGLFCRSNCIIIVMSEPYFTMYLNALKLQNISLNWDLRKKGDEMSPLLLMKHFQAFHNSSASTKLWLFLLPLRNLLMV